MKAYAFVALAFAQVAAGAAAASAECPLTLPAGLVSVRAPGGWVGGPSQTFVRLTEFGMMAGPPESMTYLAPSPGKSGKGGEASAWEFAAGDEKWLYCRYGGTNAIQISKQLDRATTSCAAHRTIGKRGVFTHAAVVCASP